VDTPTVRIVVLNYDGGEMTMDALGAVIETDWPQHRRDIVLVDNGSTDGIATRVELEIPEVRVIRSTSNLGYAGGNNLALGDLDGVDHVALVNNDAFVEPGWLHPLVDTMGTSDDVGAVAPKVLFASSFVDLDMDVEPGRPNGFRISAVRVGGVDVTRHAQVVDGFSPPLSGSTTRAVTTTGRLRVPVPPGSVTTSCELCIHADVPTDVTFVSGASATPATALDRPIFVKVALDAALAYDVIANAGSELLLGEYGADRCHLERDDTNAETRTGIFAWCGAAVLLRREYLEDVGLFDERLFLYYEDLELSWRGLDRGWRYRYEPRSVVRHVHAATAVERSPTSAYYNSRNRLLVLARHASWSQAMRTIGHQLTGRHRPPPPAVEPFTLPQVSGVHSVGRRLRAAAGFLRLAPSMLASRRRDRRARDGARQTGRRRPL